MYLNQCMHAWFQYGIIIVNVEQYLFNCINMQLMTDKYVFTHNYNSLYALI